MGVCLFGTLATMTPERAILCPPSLPTVDKLIWSCGSGVYTPVGEAPINLSTQAGCDAMIGRNVPGTIALIIDTDFVAYSDGCCVCGFNALYCDPCYPKTNACLSGQATFPHQQVQTFAQCRAQLADPNCVYSRYCCGTQCTFLSGNAQQVFVDNVNCQHTGTNILVNGLPFYDCPPCNGTVPVAGMVYTCQQNQCGGSGCCLCDRCCDGLTNQQCLDKGGRVMSGSCSQAATQTECRNANQKPACKSTRMGLAIRPSQHYPNEAGQNPAAPGRLEIVSRNPQRAKDRAVATDECRYVYAWGQKAVGNDGAIEGRMCNQFNRNCASSKVTQKARLVKSQSFPGAVEFYGQYRAACPEQADFVSNCSTRVPCPA